MPPRNRQKDDFVLEFLCLCFLIVAAWGGYVLILENADLMRE